MVTRRSVLGLLGAGLLASAGGTRAAEGAEADRAAIVNGNNEFGLDLYARLRATRGNVFFSPYSLSCALGMAYAGARGETADEMAKALRFSLPPGRVHPAFGSLIRAINAPGTKRANELSTANALWSQKGQSFADAFQRIARDSYGAAVEELDFQRATETARRTINAWVEKQTQDKIVDLIREGVLKPDTILVLTNAIYFKGDWMSPFPTGATQPGDFAVDAAGRVSGVPLMRQTSVYRYLEGDGFQALELPYRANELSMIVVLPRDVDGLEALERTLTVARVDDWLVRMVSQEVAVVLPRFKVTAEFRLEQPLQALGMRQAFSRAHANFSGMLQPPRRIVVDAVIHKAYVDVSEKGTEAAAATAIGMRLASARSTAPVFRADHPFLFLIRDQATGSILFAGRLVNPVAS
jgi:serpin B